MLTTSVANQIKRKPIILLGILLSTDDMFQCYCRPVTAEIFHYSNMLS